MSWAIVKSIVPALSSMLGELFCNPKAEEDVIASLQSGFYRYNELFELEF